MVKDVFYLFFGFITLYTSKGVETENDCLPYPRFCERDETILVFGDSVSNMVRVAKEMRKRFKVDF